MAQLKDTAVHGNLTVTGQSINCTDVNSNLRIDKINGKYLYQSSTNSDHNSALLYFDSTNKILYVNIPDSKK